MGQQQLLLLVVGIVIVGLAVVVGIQQFGEGSKKAEVDYLTVEAVRMATGASAWRQTPVAMGGGGGTSSFATFSLANLGFQNIVFENADSQVAFDGTIYHSVWARGQPVTFVAVINANFDAQANVFLYGPGPNCIVMQTGRIVDGTMVFTPASTPARPSGCAW